MLSILIYGATLSLFFYFQAFRVLSNVVILFELLC